MFAIKGSAGPHFLCSPEGRTLPCLSGLLAGATVLGVPRLAMTSRRPLPLSSHGLLLVCVSSLFKWTSVILDEGPAHSSRTSC